MKEHKNRGKAENKRDKKITRFIIFFGTLALIIVYIVSVNREEKRTKNEQAVKYVETIVSGDIELDYPGSPREVIMLFNKLISCYYESDLDDDVIKELMLRERQLFDQELLEHNTFKEQLKNLKAEIKEFKDSGRTIIGMQVQKSSGVETWKQADKEYASLIASYTLKDKDVTKTYERFIFRKDDEGKWRILGWQISPPIELN